MKRFSWKRLVKELKKDYSFYLVSSTIGDDIEICSLPTEALNLIKRHSELINLTDKEYDTVYRLINEGYYSSVSSFKYRLVCDFLVWHFSSPQTFTKMSAYKKFKLEQEAYWEI